MTAFRIFDDRDEKPRLPEAGDRIGSHKLVKHLGDGAMSKVFLAHRDGEPEQVAMKFLDIHQYLQKPGELAMLKRRFEQEIRLISKLDHPNLLHVYDFDAEAVIPWYTMDYIDGYSLEQCLQRTSIPSYAEVCFLAIQVIDGLEAAWKQTGSIHRDLKPGNLMLTAEGSIKIIDWGIAKIIGGDTHLSAITTMSGMAIGTPRYMAPEQHLGDKDIDFRADIFALGVMLCELLSFRFPFAGHNHIELLNDKLNTCAGEWERYAPGLPPGFSPLVNAMMAPKPRDRPDDYQGLRTSLWELSKNVSAEPRRAQVIVGTPVDHTQLFDPAMATTRVQLPTDFS